ncbi:hypothetical protein JB92DRAFT_2835267 [Gautieria morchelliformis]|nr:hypothetical protein JB92DRAFT_2835267 [Gautieria morchelliformis]
MALPTPRTVGHQIVNKYLILILRCPSLPPRLLRPARFVLGRRAATAARGLGVGVIGDKLERSQGGGEIGQDVVSLFVGGRLGKSSFLFLPPAKGAPHSSETSNRTAGARAHGECIPPRIPPVPPTPSSRARHGWTYAPSASASSTRTPYPNTPGSITAPAPSSPATQVLGHDQDAWEAISAGMRTNWMMMVVPHVYCNTIKRGGSPLPWKGDIHTRRPTHRHQDQDQDPGQGIWNQDKSTNYIRIRLRYNIVSYVASRFYRAVRASLPSCSMVLSVSHYRPYVPPPPRRA